MPDKEIQAESPISRGIREFLVWCRMEKGLSRNSLDAYAADLAGFLPLPNPFLRTRYPEPETSNPYLTRLYQKKLSSRSIARHLSAVRSLFHFLLTEGLVSKTPPSTSPARNSGPPSRNS